MKKFIFAFMITNLVSVTAHAFNAYHLYNKDGQDHWAVECADGTIHSYAGSSGGLAIVGPALCEGHGGMAEPDDDIVTTMPAKACMAVETNRPTTRPHLPTRR